MLATRRTGRVDLYVSGWLAGAEEVRAYLVSQIIGYLLALRGGGAVWLAEHVELNLIRSRSQYSALIFICEVGEMLHMSLSNESFF